MTYEQKIHRIEFCSYMMREKDVTLAQQLDYFEEAVGLIRECKSELRTDYDRIKAGERLMKGDVG